MKWVDQEIKFKCSEMPHDDAMRAMLGCFPNKPLPLSVPGPVLFSFVIFWDMCLLFCWTMLLLGLSGSVFTSNMNGACLPV